MRRIRAIAGTTAVLVAMLVALQPSAAAKGPGPGPTPTPPPPPPPVAPVQLVFASGLDHGLVSATTPGMHQTEAPGAVLEWQNVVARTGTGAYHAVGGNVQGDESIDNENRALPFGGLEVWAGGAFRFTSFPTTGSHVWLLSTVPTDGVLGADDKPVVSIGPSGTLRLSGSNSGASYVESHTVLARNHWYDLVVHGRNGIAQKQQLYIYDGQTDALLERLDLTLTVAGTFRNRLTKWGFGTSQDATGLEYYLDDIFHARGPTNPGPVRVYTRTAIGTQATGFSAVGAPSGNTAVDDCAPDADATYIASAADAGAHSAKFTLATVPLSPGNGVYAVQMFSIGRSATPRSLSAQAGITVGGVDSTSLVSLATSYAVKRTVFLTNPFTGQPWSLTGANGFSGVVKDTGVRPPTRCGSRRCGGRSCTGVRPRPDAPASRAVGPVHSTG